MKQRIKERNDEIAVIKNRTAKKEQKINLTRDKIAKYREMIRQSESFFMQKNEKDGTNALKLKVIEYEKQRIDELNKFIFNIIEIKPKL